MPPLTALITGAALATATPFAAPAPRAPDVIVYSGVPCGIAASVSAAREGAKVVLIEPTRHVGGLSTSGINTAESEHMLKWTIGGFADEFYRRLGRHYQDTRVPPKTTPGGNPSIISSRASRRRSISTCSRKRAWRSASARAFKRSRRTARGSPALP